MLNEIADDCQNVDDFYSETESSSVGFFKTSQNWQENNCAGDWGTGVFFWSFSKFWLALTTFEAIL